MPELLELVAQLGVQAFVVEREPNGGRHSVDERRLLEKRTLVDDHGELGVAASDVRGGVV